ncbi:DUF167 domain-containing protein [Micavibrio aeruginosavorus]|uniref:DUF167 domain-containing protein n=1 Tax=Micavibrio aeruginosavorus TaxID=349221 RepID=UPI003F4AEDDD
MAQNNDLNGAILHIRLSPGASSDGFRGWMVDEQGRNVLKISVTAIAENGKANDALIKLLSKTLKHPKTAIEIRSGHTDRNKVLYFDRLDSQAIEKAFPKT